MRTLKQAVALVLVITSCSTYADFPKVTILSTMVSNFSGDGEWGFSALLETENGDILFDTGFKPDTVLNNAKALNIDLSNVERVILSHFHTDHTGGLFTLRRHFRKVNPQAFSKVYVGKGFFEQRFDRALKPSYSLLGTENGFSTAEAFRTAAEGLGIKFVVLETHQEIEPGLFLSGPVKRTHDERNYNPGYFLKSEGDYVPDYIPESQVLGIQKDDQWVLLSGCGHAGIINASEKLRSIKPQNIVMGIGGFHLFRANQETIDWTVDHLREFGLKKFVGAHCTGVRATYQIQAQLDLPHSDVSVGAIGTQIDSQLNIIRASIE